MNDEQIAILANEFSLDPIGIGWASMSISEKVIGMNDPIRPSNRNTMTGSELWENTEYTEYSNLTDSNKQQWIGLCGVDNINPFGPAVDFVIDVYGTPVSSVTTSALAVARVELISRARELGLPFVREDHIIRAGG